MPNAASFAGTLGCYKLCLKTLSSFQHAAKVSRFVSEFLRLLAKGNAIATFRTFKAAQQHSITELKREKTIEGYLIAPFTHLEKGNILTIL